MVTAQKLLRDKGDRVWSLQPDATVLDAIKLMADKDIGSVMVLEGDQPVGIFTERHYSRKVYLKGKASPDTQIRNVMSKSVICAKPDYTVEECMAVMNAKRIRHLPVVEKGHLIGILSIGDLVKGIIANQDFEIKQLEHLIRGTPA